jgi:hypothetical protein
VTLAALIMVLPATSLGIPSAQAADGLNTRNVSGVRIDATDQLVLNNKDELATFQFDFVDPVYGPQSITLAPGTSNNSAPMCAVPAEANPNPVITVTLNPGTPSAVTGELWFYSLSNSTYNVEYLQQDVIKKESKVVKAKQRVAKAKAAVKKAKAVLTKAKTSHRASWIGSASRWLTKTKSRLAVMKAKMATRKADLKSAKQSLLDLQKDMAYCKGR